MCDYELVFFGGNMIVAFCGHSSYVPALGDKDILLGILEKLSEGDIAELLLGENGGFDDFAFECSREFCFRHPGSRLIFVTPYLRESKRPAGSYDQIIYPELENVPQRFAICHRNRKMVNMADAVIACVKHSYGGAYATYKYAIAKGKKVFNIAQVSRL